jgi:hypothetical protein
METANRRLTRIKMTRYNELTPERLACLKAVAAASGRTSHDDETLAPFCDDKSTLTHPDVFNQCHDGGWLTSSHDDRTGTSFVWLTDAGKAALAV